MATGQKKCVFKSNRLFQTFRHADTTRSECSDRQICTIKVGANVAVRSMASLAHSEDKVVRYFPSTIALPMACNLKSLCGCHLTRGQQRHCHCHGHCPGPELCFLADKSILSSDDWLRNLEAFVEDIFF